MLQTIKLIVTEEGVGALFKGVVPRVLQLGLNHAIRFTGYQVRPSADVRVCALAVRACACLCVHVCVGRRSCAAGTRDACPP
ncbi:MAG: MC/SLC25 family protein, partial [Promethearchaeia archaeon]